jgi:hypothetical protein
LPVRRSDTDVDVIEIDLLILNLIIIIIGLRTFTLSNSEHIRYTSVFTPIPAFSYFTCYFSYTFKSTGATNTKYEKHSNTALLIICWPHSSNVIIKFHYLKSLKSRQFHHTNVHIGWNLPTCIRIVKKNLISRIHVESVNVRLSSQSSIWIVNLFCFVFSINIFCLISNDCNLIIINDIPTINPFYITKYFDSMFLIQSHV